MNVDSIEIDVSYALRQLQRVGGRIDAVERAIDALERVRAELDPVIARRRARLSGPWTAEEIMAREG